MNQRKKSLHQIKKIKRQRKREDALQKKISSKDASNKKDNTFVKKANKSDIDKLSLYLNQSLRYNIDA